MEELEQYTIRWPNDIFGQRPESEPELKKQCVRKFESGATRDVDDYKLDFEAGLSPIVLEAYAEYLLSCSHLPDGTSRPCDNWQKGISQVSYMKSLMRHTFDVWKLHRGYKVNDRKTGLPISIKKALCAVMFNTMGYLYEELKKENGNN